MVVKGIVLGIIATIGMDLWALLLKRVFHVGVTDWALVGRWVAWFPRGRFFHSPIAASQPVRNELALGWCVHYLIGIIYGLLYLGILLLGMETEPTPASAVLFGLVTLVSPWLIMQPGMGAGVFAMKTPNPWAARLKSISMHLVFAAGLYGGWVLLQHL